MKKITLVLVILIFGTKINAQWADNGNYMTTNDKVGIGLSPSAQFQVRAGTSTISYFNGVAIYNNAGNAIRSSLSVTSDDDGRINLYNNATSLKVLINSYGDSYFMGGNIGIGTSSPSEKFVVANSNSGVISRFISTSHGGLSGLRLQGETADGSDVRFMDIAYDAETDSYGFGAGSYSSVLPISSGFSQADIVVNGSGKVGIGTTDFTGNHKLRVEGSIGAREIKVEASGWSDFVFKKGYALRTLTEVEKHITEKGHLPEIPNEAEVTKNGINLGEMNTKLLQKIEELTLYLIEQNKQNQAQQGRIEKLEKELSALKNE